MIPQSLVNRKYFWFATINRGSFYPVSPPMIFLSSMEPEVPSKPLYNNPSWGWRKTRFV